MFVPPLCCGMPQEEVTETLSVTALKLDIRESRYSPPPETSRGGTSAERHLQNSTTFINFHYF